LNNEISNTILGWDVEGCAPTAVTASPVWRRNIFCMERLASAGDLGLSFSHLGRVEIPAQDGLLPTQGVQKLSISGDRFAQFTQRNILKEDQLDQCAQPTKKRIKSGIADAS
jgi:hypothetical protein